MQAHVIHSPSLRRGIAISMLLHAAVVAYLLWRVDRDPAREAEIVDIEVAPAAPHVEALPAEVAHAPEETEPTEEELAATTPMPLPEDETQAADAGVDAPLDAPPPDAPEQPEKQVAVAETESGSAATVTTTDPAVEGAPTTAGTAANLLAYFPPGHTITALIRFDRLRGTEWAQQTEALLHPMPDYRILFGNTVANIADKIDTLVISTPRPKDATATTLVAHTKLARPALRDFLAATTSVAWSAAKGGLLGRRTGKVFPSDHRVFLSPFQGWFVLAEPDNLGGLAAAAGGNLDTVVATGKLPPWLAGIRAIESESGADRGPALVVTIGIGGKRYDLGNYDFGLGVKTFPTPDRVSAALELVTQGWLVRGNMRFANDAEAAEFVAAAQEAQKRVAHSTMHQLALGKPLVRVVANLAFAQSGPRVSYATSVSIADFRAILAVAAQTLESYFKAQP